MGSNVKNGNGPQYGASHGHEIANQGHAISPLESYRVKQDRQAAQANNQAQDLARGKLLTKNKIGGRCDPQGSRIDEYG